MVHNNFARPSILFNLQSNRNICVWHSFNFPKHHVCRQGILEFRGVQTGGYPKLGESLNVIQMLLEA